MNRKALLINYYYPPINNGGIQRILNFKKYLPEYGFDTAIITTNSYGILDDDQEERVFRFPDSGVDYTNRYNNRGIKVFLFRSIRRLKVYFGLITDGKYYWKKEAVKHLDELLKTHQFDIVIASYPTPVNLEIGEIINRRYGIPLVVDYRDGLMFEPFKEVYDNSVIYQKRLLALERRLAQIASLTVTVNQRINDYYSSTYPGIKSVVIQNGFDDEEVIDCPPILLPEGLNIVHTGAIGKSRHNYTYDELSVLFENLCTISEHVNIILIGDYEERELDIFARYKNIFVYEKTDRKRVIATQRAANALLLISGPYGYTSGKFYEYLFSGKPILNIADKTGIADIINGRDFGITCRPDNREAIKEFIEKLVNSELSFNKPSLNRYTRRYQSQVLAKQLQNVLDHIS